MTLPCEYGGCRGSVKYPGGSYRPTILICTGHLTCITLPTNLLLAILGFTGFLPEMKFMLEPSVYKTFFFGDIS